MTLLGQATRHCIAQVKGGSRTEAITNRIRAPLIGGVVGFALLLDTAAAQSQDEIPAETVTQGPSTEAVVEEEKIIEAIKETFPEEPEAALAIAECESELDVNAISPTDDVGLMQINLPSHGEKLDELGLDGFDLEDNLAYSRSLYEESGWEPWVCAQKLGLVEGDSPTS